MPYGQGRMYMVCFTHQTQPRLLSHGSGDITETNRDLFSWMVYLLDKEETGGKPHINPWRLFVWETDEDLYFDPGKKLREKESWAASYLGGTLALWVKLPTVSFLMYMERRGSVNSLWANRSVLMAQHAAPWVLPRSRGKIPVTSRQILFDSKQFVNLEG